MGDEYHKNYNELITLEKTLNGQITELQKCLDAKTNSIKLEMQIKDNITAHQKKRESLLSAHEKNASNLPGRRKTQKEPQHFKTKFRPDKNEL